MYDWMCATGHTLATRATSTCTCAHTALASSLPGTVVAFPLVSVLLSVLLCCSRSLVLSCACACAKVHLICLVSAMTTLLRAIFAPAYSLSYVTSFSPSHGNVDNTHTCTHARTHAHNGNTRTHNRNTHARTHARTYIQVRLWPDAVYHGGTGHDGQE